MKKFNVKIIITLLLLIFAVVGIILLAGENGIITQKMEARNTNEAAEFKEKIEASISDYLVNKSVENTEAYNLLVGNLQNKGLIVDETNIKLGYITASSVPESKTSIINQADIELENGEVTYSQVTSNESNISIKASLVSGIEEEINTVNIAVTSNTDVLDSMSSYIKWTTDMIEPTSGWDNLTLEGNSGLKEGITTNSNTIEGEYYLWIKITVDGSDTVKRFGPYIMEGTPTEENITIEKIGKIEITSTTIKLGVIKTYLGYNLKYSIDNGSTYLDYIQDLTFTDEDIENRGGEITVIAKYSNGISVITKSITINKIEVINEPLLTAGMTGIYWDDSGNEITVNDSNKNNWYNYKNKKWANAKTQDGSYWVWIPRYEYKIPTEHRNTAQTIDVKGIEKTKTVADSGYTIEPAFTFGTAELEGIWVAKFEASGTTSAIDIKPNVIALRNLTISNMFTACRNIETNLRYGWGTTGNGIDSHLIKNVEWGAVAYLSSSQYGKEGEIWINPNNNYITGQSGTTVNSNATSLTSAYNTTYGINASTTGNIYGIYDMSGGLGEYTASYINNGNSTLTTYGSSLINADSKYKDIYNKGTSDNPLDNYAAASNKKGDAIYETSSNYSGNNSWYGDFSYMPDNSNPFFLRGGFCSNTTGAGAFSFDYYYGNAHTIVGFRPVLAIDSSL